jgi:hypothetical protein
MTNYIKNYINYLHFQDNNNILYGGVKKKEETLEKKIMKIIKTLKSVFKNYGIKRSKYLMLNNCSLLFNKIVDNIDNLDLLSKDKNINNINIKTNTEDKKNKYFYDIYVDNYMLKDDDYKKFWLYIHRRGFKNKKIYLHKKTKLYYMDLPELLILKLFDNNIDMSELLIKNITSLNKYNNDVKNNILNILQDLQVPNSIITIFKKKYKNDYNIKLISLL